MSDIAKKIDYLIDKGELESVLLKYYYAVDSMSDLDGIIECFTEDAVFDIKDLGLDVFNGHDAIRNFFAGVFSSTPYHCHHVSNFDVTRLEGDEASARGYVIGKAEGSNGVKVFVHCCYNIEYIRTVTGWKMRLFDEDSLVPLGSEVSDLHG